jgi:hypothetical protein
LRKSLNSSSERRSRRSIVRNLRFEPTRAEARTERDVVLARVGPLKPQNLNCQTAFLPQDLRPVPARDVTYLRAKRSGRVTQRLAAKESRITRVQEGVNTPEHLYFPRYSGGRKPAPEAPLLGISSGPYSRAPEKSGADPWESAPLKGERPGSNRRPPEPQSGALTN